MQSINEWGKWFGYVEDIWCQHGLADWSMAIELIYILYRPSKLQDVLIDIL